MLVACILVSCSKSYIAFYYCFFPGTDARVVIEVIYVRSFHLPVALIMYAIYRNALTLNKGNKLLIWKNLVTVINSHVNLPFNK